MRRFPTLFALILLGHWASAQKVENIAFNLYTDSLKKGFYNYISVDGQLSDGTWQPLDSSQIRFSANTGHFAGNDLFIDSSYKADSIIVKAVLRSNPAIWKQVTIYIRKRGFNEPLKTNDELFEEMRQNHRKKRSERSA
jgi:hypothetical protein